MHALEWSLVTMIRIALLVNERADCIFLGILTMSLRKHLHFFSEPKNLPEFKVI